MSESKDLGRRFYDEVFNAGDLDRVGHPAGSVCVGRCGLGS